MPWNDMDGVIRLPALKSGVERSRAKRGGGASSTPGLKAPPAGFQKFSKNLMKRKLAFQLEPRFFLSELAPL